jgi:hypothetical protein
VPGVIKIPCGLTGLIAPALAFCFGAGIVVDSAGCSMRVSSGGGAGVPNMALLIARAANTGAGVSGGS